LKDLGARAVGTYYALSSGTSSHLRRSIMPNYKRLKCVAVLASLFCAVPSVNAVPIYWADWVSGTGTTAIGNVTTSGSVVDITYTNPQTYYLLQTGAGVDYWQSTLSTATSPYTSDFVDNIPTASEMLQLWKAGHQTLSFSESVTNLVLSYMSLNGNGWAFNQDFEILSYACAGGNGAGYWGCGSSYKSIVDIGGGIMEYRLLGTGEPHGTLLFLDSFDALTWRSMSNETWNGFTVGVQGTSQEVLPGPSSIGFIGLGLGALFAKRFRRKTSV